MNVYSIEKVTRYLDDILEQKQKDRYELAVLVFNCVAAAQVAPSEKSAKQTARNWKKYIEAIDPRMLSRRLRRKKNPIKSIKELMTVVPVVDGKESDD